MKKINIYLLPISNKVVYPYESIRIRMVEVHHYDAKQFNQLIGLVTLIEGSLDNTLGIKKVEKFSEFGTLLSITAEESGVMQYLAQNSPSSGQNFKIYKALAFARFRVVNIIKNAPFYVATVELLTDEVSQVRELELFKSDLIIQLKQSALIYFDMIRMNEQLRSILQNDNDKSVNKLIFNIASSLEVNSNFKLKILQIENHEERINLILKVLNEKNEELKITREAEKKVRNELQAQAKLANPLGKQFDSINRQGYGGPKDDANNLEERITKADLPLNVRQTVESEYKKLKQMGSRNPEGDVVRNYLELLLDLPWNLFAEETLSLNKAQEILDKDHCGLTKVKQRILQFLAVRQLTANKKEEGSEQPLKGSGSIICFHGPPGVGKTSLGQSIAEALNRPFYRISLGGIRDEAQIRGHRRTYVAALPGQLIAAMKKVKCKNPVILLDEIDKLGKDLRGDPSSALLEVLDPEQNQRFIDHYLGLEFDLSQVLFIATANNLQNIPPPLLDRLELISIPGYTREEKLAIARTHLIPKQLNRSGLKNEAVDIEIDNTTLSKLISQYSSEAGVRQLERNIAAIYRHVALNFVRDKKQNKIIVNPTILVEILGSSYSDDSQLPSIMSTGISRGLAWTSVGGKVLLVETVKMPGKGRIEITGQLGDVMKESVKAALGYIRSNWKNISKYISTFDVDTLSVKQNNEYFDNIDLHVHFPAGGIPKDGPSAGITIATALVSLFVNRKVRDDVAMTGEITLTGQVLPVGGIKEKVLGAYESGIKIVILPFSNQRDVDDIEKKISDDMNFFFVRNISEVLDIVLEGSDLIITNKSMINNSKL